MHKGFPSNASLPAQGVFWLVAAFRAPCLFKALVGFDYLLHKGVAHYILARQPANLYILDVSRTA
jgi:hypothetical protein